MASNTAAPNRHGLKLQMTIFCLCMLAPAWAECASRSGDDETSRANKPQTSKIRTGIASFYGEGFHGDKTASGEAFDKNALVAAHPSYPIGTRVRVTNLRNGRSVTVRISDRGPSPKPQSKGIIIDVSERAATELGFRHAGTTRVRTEVVE